MSNRFMMGLILQLSTVAVFADLNVDTKPVFRWTSPNLIMGELTATTTGSTTGIQFNTGGNTGNGGTVGKAWLTSAGRLGIGTSAPGYTLDIVGSEANVYPLRVRSTNAAGLPLIKLSGSYNTGNGAELWQDATGIVRLNINSATTGLRINPNMTVIGNKFSTSTAIETALFTAEASSTPYLDFYNGTANNLTRIDQTKASFQQNVGIGLGTASPAAKLDVKGDARITSGGLSISTSGKANLTFNGGTTITAANMGSKFGMAPGPTNTTSPANLSYITANSVNGSGIGLLEADNISSPIVWMYDYGGKNAFTVAKKGYGTGSQDASAIEGLLTPLFQVRDNGYVGIGTVNPSYGLDIRTTSNTNQLRLTAALSGGAPLVKFSGGYNSGNGAEIYQDASGNFKLNINSGFTALHLGVNGTVTGNRYTTTSSIQNAMFTAEASGTPYLEFWNGTSNNVTKIDQTKATFMQKVGISRTSPEVELDIEDNSDPDALAQVFLRGNTGGGGALRFFELTTERVTLRSDAGVGDFSIQTGGTPTNGPSEKMRVRANGWVGIGTPDPQKMLHVAGEAKIDGALTVASVNTKVWSIAPDYVFEDDYKLASLEHVESYVKKNKHLPEVPSAREIKEKGMDLAEMNLVLLKKVEELTLHSIRQEKELRKQAADFADFKKRHGDK